MALGGQGGSIFRLVLAEALRLAGAGIAIGLGGAAALTQLISAQLSDTAPIDAATFTAVAVLMVIVPFGQRAFPRCGRSG